MILIKWIDNNYNTFLYRVVLVYGVKNISISFPHKVCIYTERKILVLYLNPVPQIRCSIFLI